jgi:hypothetical protein
VPDIVKTSFQKPHPSVNDKWKKEGDNFEVNFKQAGHDTPEVVKTDGTILETETAIAVNELPQAAITYIVQHYKGAKIKESAKTVNAAGEITFEAEVNDTGVIFDATGKFLKEARE